MDYIFRQVSDNDSGALLSIFNHYVETDYSAYFDKKVDEFFIERLRQMTSGYPFYVIETPEKQVVGFGLIHRYHPAGAFNRVGELSYFISPSHARKGLGTRLLKLLIENAIQMGMDSLLASISSLNEASVEFHKKNGFIECGKFVKVGQKFGQEFDNIWMQKHLH